MSGPLHGILVADFSRVLAGPYATMLLADLGATVIKVEKPGSGDDTRRWSPPETTEGRATYFESVNRNKRSITLDLNDHQDRRRAQNLAAKSDIFVENYKVGALAKFGLDYPAVTTRNPGVIYCSISGFGDKGGRDLPGYDLLVQAMGGLMSITGEDTPTKVGVALVDVLTGLHASVAMLAALHERDESGQGQHVSTNLLSALLSSMVNQSTGFTMGGVVPTFLGNAHPSVSPYEVFRCSDQDIVIAVGNDTQFHALCQALDLDSCMADPRFTSNSERVRHREELGRAINGQLATHTAHYWADLLTAAGVPCGPINNMSQAFALAERLGLNPVIDGHVAHPVTYSRTPADAYVRAPLLGDSTAAIIEELSLDDLPST